jgi:hypothetical protein
MAKKMLYSSVLLLIGAIFLIPAATPVHAQYTGTVCIIPTSSSSCPSSSPTISGTVGTQLRVSIFIQGSDGLNGFDVILLADHTVVRPASIDLSGTVLLGTPTILAECIGGILVRGNACSSVDTVDTIELAASNALGQGNTATPTTGLLFTAIYNVTSTTTGTSLGYQTDCSNGSVAGTTTCVTVANGTPTPDPENAQTATFTTGAPAPDFSVTASPSTLTIQKAQVGIETLTITSLNGFSGIVSGRGSISPVLKNGPSFPGSSSLSISSGQTVNFGLAINTSKHTPQRNYVLTYVLTSGSLSHTATFTVTVSK